MRLKNTVLNLTGDTENVQNSKLEMQLYKAHTFRTHYPTIQTTAAEIAYFSKRDKVRKSTLK